MTLILGFKSISESNGFRSIHNQPSDLDAGWRIEQTQRLPGAPSRHRSAIYSTGLTASHRISKILHMHKLVGQKLVTSSFEVKQAWGSPKLT
jgi:hypothetical protein